MGAPKLIVAGTHGPTWAQGAAPQPRRAAVRALRPPPRAGGAARRLLADGSTVVAHAAHVHDERLADVTEALAVRGRHPGRRQPLRLPRRAPSCFGSALGRARRADRAGPGAKRWEASSRPWGTRSPGWSRCLSGRHRPGPGRWDPDRPSTCAGPAPPGVRGVRPVDPRLPVTLQRLRVDQVAAFASGLGWVLAAAPVRRAVRPRRVVAALTPPPAATSPASPLLLSHPARPRRRAGARHRPVAGEAAPPPRVGCRRPSPPCSRRTGRRSRSGPRSRGVSRTTDEKAGTCASFRRRRR